jgi:Ethanolamine utilization protein EutJ (predicted chaperonin)
VSGIADRPVEPWTLSVDFGTTNTVAATRRDGSTEAVLFGSRRLPTLPSGIFVEKAGSLITGDRAINKRQLDPDRFLATPKRFLGAGATTAILASGRVKMVDVVAAILAEVALQAGERFGESRPSRVVLTHPAEWSSEQTGVLLAAAEQAGLGTAQLVPEPVAAALRIAADRLADGAHLAVYDLGGGTFDAAVLTRRGSAFDVAAIGGKDGVGGELFEEALREHLGAGPVGSFAVWQWLTGPAPSREDDYEGYRRWCDGRRLLEEQIRLTKEALSDDGAADLIIPGHPEPWTVTRDELEQVLREPLEQTVDILMETIADAGLEPADLSAVYLVGGASRMPLVRALLGARVPIPADRREDPQMVVALGASSYQPTPAAVVPPVVAPPVVGKVTEVAPKHDEPVVVPPVEKPPATSRRVILARLAAASGGKARARMNEWLCDAPGLRVELARVQSGRHALGETVVATEKRRQQEGWQTDRPSEVTVPGAQIAMELRRSKPGSLPWIEHLIWAPPFRLLVQRALATYRATSPLEVIVAHDRIDLAVALPDDLPESALFDPMTEKIVLRSKTGLQDCPVIALWTPLPDGVATGHDLAERRFADLLLRQPQARRGPRTEDVFFAGQPAVYECVKIGSRSFHRWHGILRGRAALVEITGGVRRLLDPLRDSVQLRG